MKTYTIKFKDYKTSLPELLSLAVDKEILSHKKRILIKPNLVNEFPPPVTTPVELVREIIIWLQTATNSEIIIAEGTGSVQHETADIFKIHNYDKLANEAGISLFDLNTAHCLTLKDQNCSFFPSFHMPEIMLNSFIISVPVLKAHSLAKISGTMKNMMGCAPPKFYQTNGRWKKSKFHENMHRAIYELNLYRTPDFTIMDAVTGLAEHHLGGRYCNPPVNKLIAGTDPLDVDRTAAGLLGFDWKTIPHLNDSI